jgi:hypothetical protein
LISSALVAMVCFACLALPGGAAVNVMLCNGGDNPSCACDLFTDPEYGGIELMQAESFDLHC